jgi:hypothetical protein
MVTRSAAAALAAASAAAASVVAAASVAAAAPRGSDAEEPRGAAHPSEDNGVLDRCNRPSLFWGVFGFLVFCIQPGRRGAEARAGRQQNKGGPPHLSLHAARPWPHDTRARYDAHAASPSKSGIVSLSGDRSRGNPPCFPSPGKNGRLVIRACVCVCFAGRHCPARLLGVQASRCRGRYGRHGDDRGGSREGRGRSGGS